MINSGRFEGIFYHTFSSDYVSYGHLKWMLDWETTADIFANTSILKLTLSLQGGGTGGHWTGNDSGSRIIRANYEVNGVIKTSSINLSQMYTEYGNSYVVSFAPQTYNITHNEDGSASAVIGVRATGDANFYVGYSRYYMENGNLIQQAGFLPVGYSATLPAGVYNQYTTFAVPQIPRATEITSFPSFTIGTNFNVTLNRKSTEYTNTLVLKSGNTTIKTVTGVTTSATISLTTAEQDALCATIPNSTVGAVTLQCTTMKGSTQIGSPVTATANATVPASVVPTFTSITATELVSNVKTIVGAFAKSLSNIELKINGAAGAKGSTISSYKINLNGIDYASATVSTGILNWSGTKTITATVTDSRNRTATKTLNITALDYTMPTITNFTVERCNSDGTLNALGTYARITRKATIGSLNSKNQLSFAIQSKLKSSSTWSSNIASGSETVGTTVMDGYSIVSTYVVTSSYDFVMNVSDKFNTSTAYFSLSTGQVVMSWGKTGVGIGKVWEQGALDVQGNVHINGTLSVQSSVSITADMSVNKINSIFVPSLDNLGVNVNFDNVLKAGTYRVETGFTNGPNGAAAYGNLTVFKGAVSDTLMQLYHSYNSGEVWTRGAYNVGLSTPVWTNWLKMVGTSSAIDNATPLNDISTAVRYIDRDNVGVLNNANYGHPYVTTVSDSISPQIGLPGYWYHIMYFRHLNGDGFGAQLAIDLNYDNRMYLRTSSGTSWRAWTSVTHQYGTGAPPTLTVGSFYWQHE